MAPRASIERVPGAVLEWEALAGELVSLRSRGARIVLTNGVFDLLHVGHLRYLREAARYGDALVVGVNADASVTKPGRPIVPEADRAELVAALEPVSWVVIFAERTADALLRAVRPQVYVKGGDYNAKTLPEAATAREIGATLVFVPSVPERSTSALIQKLQRPVTWQAR